MLTTNLCFTLFLLSEVLTLICQAEIAANLENVMIKKIKSLKKLTN
jgi:hypothetical protein